MIWIFIIFFVGCSESQLPKEKKTNTFHEHEILNPQIIISREDAKIVLPDLIYYWKMEIGMQLLLESYCRFL